ncbi:hypothetical protein [Sporomusa termitida]|uniref:Uncharacterized protein n=1 Tax=Sporomusa termitida TaxID=2377 RepID=A0A517DWK7_9FIRM|nr:hypothetical protein [Sporomusa termitida]QDR81713.1 hypothetical protein SPTER_31250 [Sporomusa termitida]
MSHFIGASDCQGNNETRGRALSSASLIKGNLQFSVTGKLLQQTIKRVVTFARVTVNGLFLFPQGSSKPNNPASNMIGFIVADLYVGDGLILK